MLFSWSPSSQCWSSFSRINCPTILSGDSLALCVTMSRCHEVGLSEMCEMWLTDCSSCYSSAGVGKRMLWLAKLGCKWCSSVLHSFASNSHLAPARDCFVTACSSLGRAGTSQMWSPGDQPAATSWQILNSPTTAQRRVWDGEVGSGSGLAGLDGIMSNDWRDKDTFTSLVLEYPLWDRSCLQLN